MQVMAGVPAESDWDRLLPNYDACCLLLLLGVEAEKCRREVDCFMSSRKRVAREWVAVAVGGVIDVTGRDVLT